MPYVLPEPTPILYTIPFTERLRFWFIWVLVSMAGTGFALTASLLVALFSLFLLRNVGPPLLVSNFLFILCGALSGVMLGLLQGIVLRDMATLQRLGHWAGPVTRLLSPLEAPPRSRLIARWLTLDLTGRWVGATMVAGTAVGYFAGFGVDDLRWLGATTQNSPFFVSATVCLGAGIGAVVGAVQGSVLRQGFAGAFGWIPIHSGVAALSLILVFNSYQLPIAEYFYFDEDLLLRAIAGVLLAVGLSWVLGGMALAWGLRLPDPVAFAAPPDTASALPSPRVARISSQSSIETEPVRCE